MELHRLVIIYGSKIYAEFIKYQGCRRIINEIIAAWSSKDVEDWLREKEIEPVIADNIRPADGKTLYQIYKMQSSCPEFFYSSVSSNNRATMAQVAKFGHELKDLFGNLK